LRVGAKRIAVKAQFVRGGVLEQPVHEYDVMACEFFAPSRSPPDELAMVNDELEV
jgi:hypothetical protein